MARSTRNQPFCWQEKKILRLFRNCFEKNELVKFRVLYGTITEIDSDFNGKDIKFYTKTISTYSGLSKEWIPKGLKKLEELQIIKIVQEKEGGKFTGKRIVFTPENIIDETQLKTVHGKPVNGESFNGNLEPSEDINYLEDINYKEDSIININNATNFQLEMILKQHNLNLQASKLLQLAKGDYDLVVKYINAFKDKGEGYLFSAIKDKYKLPVEEVKKVKVKKELTIKEKDWRGVWF